MVRLIPVLLAALALTGPAHTASPAGKPADFYVQDKVWTIHLSIGAKEWEKMQPTRGGFGGAGAGAGKQAAPLSAERRLRGGFQFDFEYVKGDITIDGILFKDVAIRLKGSGSYAMAMQSAKKSFRVSFDRYVEGNTFKGISKLTLNNNALDPTMHREALSYAVYRAAGVPAPRTAYAEVTISVPGKYDKEFLGLYTLIETIDKPFLKEHFGSSKGLLVKPERVGPLDYLGEDWRPYQEKYRPKGEVSKKRQRRLIDFARLVQKDDAATFQKNIESYLDVDRFLRFLASTVLLANMDSFIGLNHNWMMYLDPKTDKFVLLPWDLDLSFGAFQMLGSRQALEDLSIRRPYPGQNRLIERVLAEERYYTAYTGHLAKLLKSGFTRDAVKKDLAAIKKATEAFRKREEKAAAARRDRAAFGVAGILGHTDIEGFVAKRIDSVRAQLDGKSKGTTPQSGFGPGGGNTAR